MPRFVILDHDHPKSHFDLMIEFENRLRTWRLHGNPLSSHVIPAEPIGDHRIEYLEYEGPVSSDRGRVIRWDMGMAEFTQNTPTQIVIQLDGVRCRGRGELQRSGDDWAWSWNQLRD